MVPKVLMLGEAWGTTRRLSEHGHFGALALGSANGSHQALGLGCRRCFSQEALTALDQSFVPWPRARRRGMDLQDHSSEPREERGRQEAGRAEELSLLS